MSIELVAATPEQAGILENLLELYVHDMSEFFEVPLGEDGRFRYPNLPLYWSEAGRYAFLVRVDGKLAGFVFVKQVSGTDGGPIWDMAEFFVIRGLRRRRVGLAVAREVWKRFPGEWEVRVTESNAGGQRFWPKAIGEFVGAAVEPLYLETSRGRWTVYSFFSNP